MQLFNGKRVKQRDHREPGIALREIKTTGLIFFSTAKRIIKKFWQKDTIFMVLRHAVHLLGMQILVVLVRGIITIQNREFL